MHQARLLALHLLQIHQQLEPARLRFESVLINSIYKTWPSFIRRLSLWLRAALLSELRIGLSWYPGKTGTLAKITHEPRLAAPAPALALAPPSSTPPSPPRPTVAPVPIVPAPLSPPPAAFVPHRSPLNPPRCPSSVSASSFWMFSAPSASTALTRPVRPGSMMGLAFTRQQRCVAW